MARRVTSIVFSMLIATVGLIAQPAWGCPFCTAVSQTFSEEINAMDVVAIARLVESPPISKSPSPTDEVVKSKFEVVQIIKGSSLLGSNKLIETIYFGDAKKGQEFLVMGVDPPKLMWSTPLGLTKRGRDYISKIVKLPKEGTDRLVFFQEYLEDRDEMLARDAYDEFAKAPYAIVQGLKSKMKHDQLIAWIKSPDIPASRRRLYLTMLGVCGSSSDLPTLEAMLKSDDRKTKAGLDAMIACYLTLKGASGMPLIEELFLKNQEAEYADTYAAIMALRFHAVDADVVPLKRILQGLRHMLDRPKLADLVIPDLARWEDWSVMEKLVKLYKDADQKTSWVRVPVVNYMRACPLPEAKKYMKELERIDPGAVKRANTFFPFTPAKKPSSSDGTSVRQPANDRTQPVTAIVASENISEGNSPHRSAANLWPALGVLLGVGAIFALRQGRLSRDAGVTG